MSPDVDSHFLHYVIQSALFQAEVRNKSLQDAVPPKINMDSLRSAQLRVTADPGEQRLVADFLSSLDVLISAQSRKLDGLRTQKKGLMQQLFPSLEGG